MLTPLSTAVRLTILLNPLYNPECNEISLRLLHQVSYRVMPLHCSQCKRYFLFLLLSIFYQHFTHIIYWQIYVCNYMYMYARARARTSGSRSSNKHFKNRIMQTNGYQQHKHRRRRAADNHGR